MMSQSSARFEEPMTAYLALKVPIYPLWILVVSYHISKSWLLANCLTLIPCLVHSSTLMMEVVCSSETLVDFQWTTWRRKPGDREVFSVISIFRSDM
jgi:hypothetical protein